MQNFTAHDETSRKQMLENAGITNIEELFSVISENARLEKLNLNDALSEMQAQKALKKLALKNKTDYKCFLGGGAYKRFIPSCISAISSRFEFLTAYTPYQPEISQGTLQVMYEFQSMICNLTGMDVSNASVYDGATACAEAVLMAVRISKKHKAAIIGRINPEYKKVIETYARANSIELTEEADETCACVLFQTPDYYGEIIPTPQAESPASNQNVQTSGILKIACVDLISLAALEPPDVDIIAGDFQSLGLPLAFGGAHGGFISCKSKYMRQLPGRIAGRTVDKDGNQAFCLTLQTREQHIRREKATSNICSNQALCALCAAVYLSVMGKKGLKDVAYLSAKGAHKLADALKAKGYNVLSRNFFNEFVLETADADAFLMRLKDNKILGGIKIDDKKILVCVTELNDDGDISEYIKFC